MLTLCELITPTLYNFVKSSYLKLKFNFVAYKQVKFNYVLMGVKNLAIHTTIIK